MVIKKLNSSVLYFPFLFGFVFVVVDVFVENVFTRVCFHPRLSRAHFHFRLRFLQQTNCSVSYFLH